MSRMHIGFYIRVWHFCSLHGVAKSVQILFNGIQAVLVITDFGISETAGPVVGLC